MVGIWKKSYSIFDVKKYFRQNYWRISCKSHINGFFWVPPFIKFRLNWSVVKLKLFFYILYQLSIDFRSPPPKGEGGGEVKYFLKVLPPAFAKVFLKQFLFLHFFFIHFKRNFRDFCKLLLNNIVKKPVKSLRRKRWRKTFFESLE